MCRGCVNDAVFGNEGRFVMLEKIKDFVKMASRAVKNYELDQKKLSNRIEKIEALLRDMTEVNADVFPRGVNSIILIGRYKGRDYVQTFVFPPDSFNELVDQLRHMQRLHKVNVVDAPPMVKQSILCEWR